MSKKAEEAALKAYPKEEGKVWSSAFGMFEFDKTAPERIAYQKGYEQAEKDTIERIRKQVWQWMPDKDGEEHTYWKKLTFNSVLHLLEEMEEE